VAAKQDGDLAFLGKALVGSLPDIGEKLLGLG
jgi:hypothetical protein